MTGSLPKLNLAPAEQALGRIIADPQTHEQGYWRCSTGMCLAGHIGAVLGVTWVNTDPDGVLREYVVSDAEHGLPMRDYLLTLVPDTLAPGVNPDTTPVESIRDYAMRILGLTSHEAHVLFHGDNTREELETGIKALANGQRIGRDSSLPVGERIVELPERRRNEYS